MAGASEGKSESAILKSWPKLPSIGAINSLEGVFRAGSGAPPPKVGKSATPKLGAKSDCMEPRAGESPPRDPTTELPPAIPNGIVSVTSGTAQFGGGWGVVQERERISMGRTSLEVLIFFSADREEG